MSGDDILAAWRLLADRLRRKAVDAEGKRAWRGCVPFGHAATQCDRTHGWRRAAEVIDDAIEAVRDGRETVPGFGGSFVSGGVLSFHACTDGLDKTRQN